MCAICKHMQNRRTQTIVPTPKCDRRQWIVSNSRKRGCLATGAHTRLIRRVLRTDRCARRSQRVRGRLGSLQDNGNDDDDVKEEERGKRRPELSIKEESGSAE